jgi:acetylornithine deacetylase/succinyl-diaminopimelate desuccinylase-like protein
MFPGRPAILLGPGDIATAHAVDECVDVRQVVDCAAIHGRIMLRDWDVCSNGLLL